jgi:hypothetical protein
MFFEGLKGIAIADPPFFWEEMPDVSGGVAIICAIGTVVLIMGALVMIVKRAKTILQ